jgi:hypothetical protein
MLKATLYGAIAAGALATAGAITPAAAAPAAKPVPELENSHVTDVKHRRWRRHHGWDHGHHYGWYHNHHPGFSVYGPGFGARVYHW